MRPALILTAAVAAAACGNGMIQIENVVPVEGPLDGKMYLDVSLDDHTADIEDAPLQLGFSSHEVDTSRGFCVSGGSFGDEICTQEAFGAHYALASISNHHAEPAIDGVTGTAQLNRYAVEIRGLSQNAPEIPGYNGFLGVSIPPGRVKTFPLVLMGLDGKSAFRNSGEATAHRYGIDFIIKGAGGLTLQGGTTVVVGEFDKCPEGTVPTSFCSPF